MAGGTSRAVLSGNERRQLGIDGEWGRLDGIGETSSPALGRGRGLFLGLPLPSIKCGALASVSLRQVSNTFGGLSER